VPILFNGDGDDSESEIEDVLSEVSEESGAKKSVAGEAYTFI
jgi:hypothetical protein